MVCVDRGVRRHLSLKRALDELCLTLGAVSDRSRSPEAEPRARELFYDSTRGCCDREKGETLLLFNQGRRPKRLPTKRKCRFR